MFPAAPAMIIAMQTISPVGTPRCTTLLNKEQKKITATSRNIVKNIVPTKSIPNAIPLFSMKRILNQLVTSTLS